MLEKHLFTDIDYYSDGKSYFIWVLFRTKFAKAYSGCPLCRPSNPSMFSYIHPLTEVFNPTAFMQTCRQEWETPRVILIPSDMPYEITDDRWEVVTQEKMLPSWEVDTQGLLEDAMAKGKTHVLATFKIQWPSYWTKPPKTLEEKREDLIENERYDDYFYDYERDGGLWCSGISMKDDSDACDAYQERNPDKCRGCRSFWMDKK